MAHVFKPPLVVGVLCSASTSKVINSCLVCICVEDVDVPQPSAHVNRAISCASICALRLVAVSLWARVGADTLGAVLQTCIIVTSRCAVSHTPIMIFSYPFIIFNQKDPKTKYLPLRSVVLEIVVGAFKEHPIQIIEGILEASDVGES